MTMFAGPIEETDLVALHLILLQHPFHNARSILDSVKDDAIWNSIPRRWALRSSVDPTGQEIIALMGYMQLCPPHVMSSQWSRLV